MLEMCGGWGGESGYGSRAEGCGDTYHLPHSGWSSLCFTTFLCVSLRKYFTQSNSVARKRKRPKSQRTLTAATRPRRQGQPYRQGWQWQWRSRRCQYRMYRTMAKADTGLNCRRCHFGGSLQPSDFFVVMHQHQHQNQHQHQHLRQHHLGNCDSVQAQNEIIPAMLLSFRGCSLMGAGLKSPSGRVRQQRLLNWLPLAANGSSTSRSFSLSFIIYRNLLHFK